LDLGKGPSNEKRKSNGGKWMTSRVDRREGGVEGVRTRGWKKKKKTAGQKFTEVNRQVLGKRRGRDFGRWGDGISGPGNLKKEKMFLKKWLINVSGQF